MIIGVDEVGDFGLSSELLNYFVGVHIDQNKGKLDIKRSQFRLWEDAIGPEHREKGEVKGRLLRDTHVESFLFEVIAPDPQVLITAAGTIPSRSKLESIQRHVDFEQQAIARVIEHHANHGHGSAKTYDNLRIWHRRFRRSPSLYLKLRCLEKLIRISVPHSLGYAQLTCLLDGGDESNIGNMSFKIDKDFVRAKNVMTFWREHLRQSLVNNGSGIEVPFIPAWPRGQAPLHRHYPLRHDGMVDVKRLFWDRIDFYDSESHWELRMADIFATALHRVRNLGKLKNLTNEIDDRLNDRRRTHAHFSL